MQLWMILGLWAIYLALTANLEPSNVVVGLLISLGVTWLLKPEPHPFNARQVSRAALALVQFAVVVARDVIGGTAQVTRFVLDPKLPIDPAIVAIPSGTHSELATALSAETITLSPGALVVEIDDDGVMYTHILDADNAPAHVAEAQRLRSKLLKEILP